MDNFTELLEMVLPEWTLKYFNLVGADIAENDGKKLITVMLEEKNELPEIPIEHRWKKIQSKGFKNLLVDDFPIRWKKVVIKLKRRVWKIEWVGELLKKDIPILFPWTKLEKEFADFLKDRDRKRAYRNFYDSKNLQAQS